MNTKIFDKINSKDAERRPRWFSHVRYKPTDAPTRQMELTNIDQGKRMKGQPNT